LAVKTKKRKQMTTRAISFISQKFNVARKESLYGRELGISYILPTWLGKVWIKSGISFLKLS